MDGAGRAADDVVIRIQSEDLQRRGSHVHMSHMSRKQFAGVCAGCVWALKTTVCIFTLDPCT